MKKIRLLGLFVVLAAMLTVFFGFAQPASAMDNTTTPQEHNTRIAGNVRDGRGGTATTPNTTAPNTSNTTVPHTRQYNRTDNVRNDNTGHTDRTNTGINNNAMNNGTPVNDYNTYNNNYNTYNYNRRYEGHQGTNQGMNQGQRSGDYNRANTGDSQSGRGYGRRKQMPQIQTVPLEEGCIIIITYEDSNQTNTGGVDTYGARTNTGGMNTGITGGNTSAYGNTNNNTHNNTGTYGNNTTGSTGGYGSTGNANTYGNNTTGMPYQHGRGNATPYSQTTPSTFGNTTNTIK